MFDIMASSSNYLKCNILPGDCKMPKAIQEQQRSVQRKVLFVQNHRLAGKIILTMSPTFLMIL